MRKCMRQKKTCKKEEETINASQFVCSQIKKVTKKVSWEVTQGERGGRGGRGGRREKRSTKPKK